MFFRIIFEEIVLDFQGFFKLRVKLFDYINYSIRSKVVRDFFFLEKKVWISLIWCKVGV